jgi:hypothetical protein
MQSRPFTLQQANSIVNDFKHLVGTSFKDDPEMAIQNIEVAPFDEENKRIFVDNYSRFGHRHDSLNGYVGHFYDVLVMAKSADPAENKVAFEHIRQYAREGHMTYVFPEYPFM